MLNPFIHWIEAKGVWAPWLFLALFVLASLLMIWRLEALSASGFEGTVLGTLIMPYCTGMGNLIFAIYIGHTNGAGADVMTNSLVNNVTNLTLVLGLPALIWGMRILPEKNLAASGRKQIVKKRKGLLSEGGAPELNRLSLLMTLLAVFFFTGCVWAVGRKGVIDFNDGLILVGIFLFWQCFHLFEVLKSDVRQGKSVFGWMFPVDLVLLGVGAYGIYVSTAWLVEWIKTIHTAGLINAQHIGWLSGWLNVLPNALLAIYYGIKGKPEVVYTSQVGDSHVSIPLCIGVYAMFHPMVMPSFFHAGMYILFAAALVHFFFVGVFGVLPRWVGLLLILAYGYFLKVGLLG